MLDQRIDQCLSSILSDEEVHIWLAHFSLLTKHLAHLQTYLSEEELQIAHQFIDKKRQEVFIIARGLLKKLLSRYLDCQGIPLTIKSGKNGKPFLEQNGFEFNLSHSADLLVYAFTKHTEVGIDIEYRRDMDIEGMSSYLFSTREQQLFQQLQAEEKQDFFFQVWTCKEALLKGMGVGLTYPPQQIEISFDSPQLPKVHLVHPVDEKTLDIHQWSLRLIQSPPGYTGALAIKNSNNNYWIRYHSLD